MSAAARKARDPLLVQLHVARRDLALDEEAYRDVLERATGTRSAGEMTAPQRRLALAAFKELGWKPQARKADGSRRLPKSKRADIRMIYALWWRLAEAGAVRPGHAALRAFVKGRTHRLKWEGAPDHIEWIEPAHAHDVIEALKVMAHRNGVDVAP